MKMCLPATLLSGLVVVLGLAPGDQPPTCCTEEVLVAVAARCTGATPCRSCKSCKSCAHCQSGGTCGACAPAKEKSTPPPPKNPGARRSTPRDESSAGNQPKEKDGPRAESADEPPAQSAEAAAKAELERQERQADRERERQLREAAVRARAAQRAATLLRLGERLEEQRNFAGALDHYRRAVEVASDATTAKLARQRIESLTKSPTKEQLPNRIPAHRVVRVLDARSVVVWLDARPVTLQLVGVDVPVGIAVPNSPDHVHQRAATLVSQWLEKHDVFVTDDRRIQADPFGRRQVYLSLAPDGPCVNRELIRQGLAAVASDRDFEEREEYLRLEAAARQAKRGIWADRP
jgi:endonuclease YncB( thermonuclease family)